MILYSNLFFSVIVRCIVVVVEICSGAPAAAQQKLLGLLVKEQMKFIDVKAMSEKGKCVKMAIYIFSPSSCAPIVCHCCQVEKHLTRNRT